MESVLGFGTLSILALVWAVFATKSAFVSQRKARASEIRAEECAQRERQIRALLIRELDLAAIALEAVSDVVFVCDEAGAVLLANPAACRLLGRPAAEACGMPFSSLVAFSSAPDAPDSDISVATILQRLSQSPREVIVGHERVRIDGAKEHRFVLRAAGVCGESGKLLASVVILRDLTESDDFESFTRCAQTIAHDVNNALCIMLGNLTMARMRADAVAGVDDLLAGAESAALRVRKRAEELSQTVHDSRAGRARNPKSPVS